MVFNHFDKNKYHMIALPFSCTLVNIMQRNKKVRKS